MSNNAHDVHKYERVKQGKNKNWIIFVCRLPDCTHSLERKLVIGKKCECWNCKNPFIMTAKHVTRRRPNCGCKDHHKKREKIISSEVINDSSIMDLLNNIKIDKGN